jgi:hypothetical protein
MPSWTWTARIAAIAVAGLGLIALLHLPFARPLLARVAGCPFDRVTPRQVELARESALRRLRGTGVAPARPALGFTLDRTTLGDVREWARREGVRCEESRQSTLVKCDNVPASVLAPGAAGSFDEVAFGFRIADRQLMNITTLCGGLDASAAAARLSETATRLERELGAPAAKRLPAGWTAAGPAFISYRFRDYLAEASAMRVPSHGVVVREHYVSAREVND